MKYSLVHTQNLFQFFRGFLAPPAHGRKVHFFKYRLVFSYCEKKPFASSEPISSIDVGYCRRRSLREDDFTPDTDTDAAAKNTMVVGTIHPNHTWEDRELHYMSKKTRHELLQGREFLNPDQRDLIRQFTKLPLTTLFNVKEEGLHVDRCRMCLGIMSNFILPDPVALNTATVWSICRGCISNHPDLSKAIPASR